jgi:hypothetical protein
MNLRLQLNRRALLSLAVRWRIAIVAAGLSAQTNI